MLFPVQCLEVCWRDNVNKSIKTVLTRVIELLSWFLDANVPPSLRQDESHILLHQFKTQVTQITRTQQQRPESPAVTLTWHAIKHKVRILDTTHSTVNATNSKQRKMISNKTITKTKQKMRAI